MAYTYLKLYVELLDDRPVAQLPDHLWRRLVECFCFARRHPAGDGSLPSLVDMAWTLRVSQEELEADLVALSQSENPAIERLPDGSWFVTNFGKRNAPDPGVERQARYRGRDAGVTEPLRARDAGVTGGARGVTPALPDKTKTTDKTKTKTETTDNRQQHDLPAAAVSDDDLPAVDAEPEIEAQVENVLQEFGVQGKKRMKLLEKHPAALVLAHDERLRGEDWPKNPGGALIAAVETGVYPPARASPAPEWQRFLDSGGGNGRR